MSVQPLAAAADPSTNLSYDLWSEPWIPVLRQDGTRRQVGIRDCLTTAHELHGFADPSPLVAASLQRLLAAVAQDIFAPATVDALAILLKTGRFDASAVDAFGEQYAGRFDLFGADTPFLQSGDIDLVSAKGERSKTVGYLFPELPTATNINHFLHHVDADYQFSPATAALGLITVPGFSSSGGAGIRPSINGVPPTYVLPAGRTLFESIGLSIVTRGYQPNIARDVTDAPFWRRDPVVGKSSEALRVGYLESLTFPARRVRLFPEQRGGYDTRTGAWSDILVRRMVFDMGHARPKDAEFWFDPFAAYRLRSNDVPVPLRPVEGKTLWREYGALFHTVTYDPSDAANSGKVTSPTVVQQAARLRDYAGYEVDLWRFRCVGLRTDMKAKIFEWTDETLDVPPELLAQPGAQSAIELGISRAEDWRRQVASIHSKHFPEHAAERQRMLANYWIELTAPFGNYIWAVAGASDSAPNDWHAALFHTGQRVLERAADEAGSRGEALRQRALALSNYRMARGRARKEWSA